MADRLPFSRLTFDTAKGSQADQSIMGGVVGGAWRPVLAVLAAIAVVTIACAGPLTGKAEGRADLQNYLKGPNLFYPARHDVNGTSTKFVIDTIGWNATRIAGNVGIGNGSVRTFDQTSTFDVEYPENAFMCGDVSTQPWIPGLKTQAPQVEAAEAEAATGSTEGEAAAPAGNVTAGKISDSINRLALQPALQDATNAGQNETYDRTGSGVFNQSRRGASNATSATNATNVTAPVSKEQATAAFENQTYAAYHPISYLSPVKDILYEHPLSTSGCAYCELLGFETPTGDLVNVGMKCTGYGY
jgi:hypothetical protein